MFSLDIIEQISKNLQLCLTNRSNTSADNLWTIHDVFSDEIIDLIKNYIDTVDESQWETNFLNDTDLRDKISWQHDTIIEMLHQGFNTLTDQINQFNLEIQQNFLGVSLWRDRPGYNIKLHTDNPEIDTAIQVYLFGGSNCPGTLFHYHDRKIPIPFVPNSGYVMTQSKNKLAHQTEWSVPADVKRYSLYAVWSRLPKHVANS